MEEENFVKWESFHSPSDFYYGDENQLSQLDRVEDDIDDHVVSESMVNYKIIHYFVANYRYLFSILLQGNAASSEEELLRSETLLMPVSH